MKRLANDIADVLSIVAREREDIWVLDGDLGDSYGLYDEATGQSRFPRFLQVGIAEQTLVAAAAGLAAAGKFPWVFSFSAFLCHRAADQIRTCVSQQGLPVVFVGSHSGAATGANGSSHAAVGDLGLLAAIGGIELWAPADTIDVHTAISSLLAQPRPAYLRTGREPVASLPLGVAPRRANHVGGELVILSTGFASHWAAAAVADLAQRGHRLAWSHVARLTDDVLHDSLNAEPAMKHVVVIEDHSVVGGLADHVRRLASPRLAVHGLGWPAGWHGESGSIDDLRRAYGLDTASLVRFIETLFSHNLQET